MTMRTSTTLIVGLLAFLLTGSALAQNAPDPTSGQTPDGQTKTTIDQLPEEVVERTRIVLSGYHGIPEKSVLEDQLTNPRMVLEVFARDANVFPLYQKQALRALGYWADPGVRAIYEQVLADRQTEQMTRHTLIGLLADHFGERAIGAISPFLDHDDVQLRLAAVAALKSIASDEALDVLREARKDETNDVVLRHIDEATTVIK